MGARAWLARATRRLVAAMGLAAPTELAACPTGTQVLAADRLRPPTAPHLARRRCDARGIAAGRVFVNDERAAVKHDQVAVVADCWDDSCRSAGPGLAVAVGRSVNYQIEACTGGTLAVLDPTTRTIRACLIEPTERDDGSLPGVRLSDARPCRPPITANTHVTFND